MAWLVAGALSWREGGLNEPEAVGEATAAYRTEQDVLGDFLESECVLDDHAKVSARDLYLRFESWYEKTMGGKTWNQTTFGRRLTDRGIEPKKVGGVAFRIGVDLQ